MTRRGVALGALGLGALGLALGAVDPTAPPAGNPVYSEALVVLDRLDAASEPVGRIPMEWAAPSIARAGLREWVDELPLDPEVRDRVIASIEADNLVDELIPFALFLKRLYTAATPAAAVSGNGVAQLSFDGWAREHLAPGPGMEHDNFRFQPVAQKPGAGGFLTRDRIARLIELYDAAWLSTPRLGDDLGTRLKCTADGPGITDAELAIRVEATRPVLKSLFAEAAGQMDAGDMKHAAETIASDTPEGQARQSAIAASLLQFVDGEVCKHYRAYARELATERAVTALLDEAIDHPDAAAAGWTWLRWRQHRHLGVQIIVDGLQGHLVRALADPSGGDAWLADTLSTAPPARPTRSAAATPAIHERFLPEFQAHGGHPLPFFEALLGPKAPPHPGIALQGISTTPTISVRNLPIVMTGAPVAGPGATGIPNFHFVDRGAGTPDAAGRPGGRAYYFYGNDALQLSALARGAGMKTLFQRLQSLDTMSCNSQYDERAGFSIDAFLNLAIGEHRRDFGEALCVGELDRRVDNERSLNVLAAALLDRAAVLATPHHAWELWDLWNQRNERVHAHELAVRIAAIAASGLPDLLQWYDPWPDHFAHAKGPYSDEVTSPTGELARLDYFLRAVDHDYDVAGVKDRTLFGMAGDHGLTPVHWFVRPETEVLDGLAKDGIRLKVTKISSDEGEGPKLTDPLHPPAMHGWDVIVASTAGGNYMMDWFVDQGPNWGRQPVLAELRALRLQSGQVIDVVDETVRRLGASLDYLVVREGPCDPNQAHVYLEGERDGKRVVAHVTRVGDRVRYVEDPPAGEPEGAAGARPSLHGDLLGLADVAPWSAAQAPSTRVYLPDEEGGSAWCVRAGTATLPDGSPRPDDPSGWCTEGQWRRAGWATRRPDAVNQLAHLYDTDRAGTVNLFPKDGIGYNTVVPGRHAGESFAEKDAFVGVWGAPVNPNAAPVPVAVNGAMPEAIYAWISGQDVVQGQDGWGYAPVLAETVR